jgi:hypothetical protein
MDYKELVAVPAGAIAAGAVELGGVLGSFFLGISTSEWILGKGNDTKGFGPAIICTPILAATTLMCADTVVNPINVYGVVHDTVYDWLS